MSNVFVSSMGGRAPGRTSGALRKRARDGACCVMALLAFAAIFLFNAAPAAAQQLQPIYLTKVMAGEGATVEGSNTAPSGMGGLATSATMGTLADTAEDKYGNLYILDGKNCVVYEVAASTGIINIVAGVPGVCADNGDGPALSTDLNGISMIAFDNSGNLLLAGSAALRKMIFSPSGNQVVTLVGTAGTSGFAGDGSVAGPGTQFKSLHGVTVDKFGNIDLADSQNYRVRQIDYSSGIINTIAGSGGNNGTGVNAAYTDISSTSSGNALTSGIYSPYGINADAAGNIYWGTFQGHTVDMYTPPAAGAATGSAVYIAGTPGKSGSAYNSCTTPVSITATSTSGCATASPMLDPRNAVSDIKGNIFAIDQNNVIRAISNGVMSTLAGIITHSNSVLSTSNSSTQPTSDYLTAGEALPATTIYLDQPYSVKIDWYNNLMVADTLADQIAELTYNTNFPATNVGVNSAAQTIYSQQTSGSSVTLVSIATTPSAEFNLGALSGCSAAGSLGPAANCQSPITFNPAYPGLRTGQLIFTDSNGNISPIALSGIGTAPEASFSQTAFTTLTGTGTAGSNANQVNAPRGGAVDSLGNIYFADSGNNVIRKIASNGMVSIVAGNGTPGYTGDGGLAAAAELNAPAKVVIDFSGNLIIADTGNNVIREVSAATGAISTIAGNGTAGFVGDNVLATSAELNAPQGVAVDPGGRVYVADTGNHAIRYFGIGGLITTIAGNGTPGYAGDGTPSGNAQLNNPTAIAVSPYGDLYIADTGNDVVREITAATQNLVIFGNITTFAGQQGQATNGGNGSMATQATLDTPSDVALDAAGDVYITAGGQIFSVNTSGILNAVAGTGATGNYSGDGTAILDTVLPAPATNIAIDGAANLYVFETAANLVLKAPLGVPTALNLGVAAAGATGAAQVATLTNTGNSPLTLSGLTTSSAEFTIDNSAVSACSTTTALAAGASCKIAVAFTPSSTDSGAISGTLTITDNTLNQAGTAQTVALTGTVQSAAATATTTTVAAAVSTYTYGSTTTVTASVSGSGSPAGNVGFAVNGTNIGTVALANGQASITLPASLSAGTNVVTATYNGDPDNGSSSGSTTITITPAQLTVTAANASFIVGATAMPNLTYSFAGFLNGDTAASAITGAPAETTTATLTSPVGTYPITIAQGKLAAANYAFTFVNGTLTVVAPPPAPTFTFTATPDSLTVTQGTTGTVSLTLTPLNGYRGTVTFSCGSQPLNILCNFKNSSVTTDSAGDVITTQLVLTANVAPYAAGNRPISGTPRLWLAFGLPFGLFGFLLGRNRRKWLLQTLGLLLVSLSIFGVAACSGDSTKNATASQTAQITVMATDATANITQSATVTLTIQKQ